MRTALTAADAAFQWLVCEPAPLTFDTADVDGLPDRQLPVNQLRELLLVPGVTADTRDAVWRKLMQLARSGDPAWVVAAVGVALPGLVKLAARLSIGRRALADDIDSEVLAGFLHALRSDDLTAPRPWLRLTWAAWRAGHKARHIDDHLELPTELPTGSSTPHLPYGHPDLILGRAVAAHIISEAQAELIGATRLGSVLVEQVAAEHGVSGSVVRMRRRRAERRLLGALDRGDLRVPRRVGPAVPVADSD
ncbi:hypothetical protein KZZ52_33670 [Dactylosporangium sp. AC04546]|uniref:hypothetical protein n=1 Tax=Dactylosporangium sp. AC04546 TaxID=2862460 RepID=UPI001EDFA8B6|nr:hypothetical protein [Dactylosporangium sp. AC04546]WVK78925.1 hypothetical protein KZZ52_33670 [Dactylosporangium sp. AC04546]